MSCRQQAGRDKQFMKKKEIKIKKILKSKKKRYWSEDKKRRALRHHVWLSRSDSWDLFFPSLSLSLSLSLSTCTSAHIILMSFTNMLVSVQAN